MRRASPLRSPAKRLPTPSARSPKRSCSAGRRPMADDDLAQFAGYQSARRNNDIVTEDAAALRFAELFAGKLRYCHDTGSWFEWSGMHWARNRTGLAFQWARELARDLARNEKARTRSILSKTAFAAGVEK